MNNIPYEQYFKRFGFSNNSIDIAFKIAKNHLNKKIDIIVEKHKIISYYANNKILPKFDNYTNNDYILDYNSNIYIYAMKEVIDILKVLSISSEEFDYLLYFEATLINKIK